MLWNDCDFVCVFVVLVSVDCLTLQVVLLRCCVPIAAGVYFVFVGDVVGFLVDGCWCCVLYWFAW